MILRPYASGEEHLADWSRVVLLLVRRRLVLDQERGRLDPNDPFVGLHLPDEAVASLLSPSGEQEAAERAGVDALDDRIAAQLARIERRARETPATTSLPLQRVFDTFELDLVARLLLAVLLAHELYPPIHDLVGRLGHDTVAPRVTVRMAMDLLSPSSQDAAALRHYFDPGHALQQNRLVLRVAPLRGHPEPPLLGVRLRAPEPLVHFVLDRDDALGSRFQPIHLQTEALSPEQLRRPEEEQELVARWIAEREAAPLLCLWGPRGVGKRSLVATHARAAQRPLVVLRPGPSETMEAFDVLLREGAREALLRDAILFVDSRDLPLLEDPPDSLLEQLERYPGQLTLSSHRRWPRPGLRRPALELGLAPPDAEGRLALWRDALPSEEELGQLNLPELARRYNLTAGAIEAAAREATNAAAARPVGAQIRTAHDLREACAHQVATRLSSLADRVHTPLDWSDVVLPEETLEQLAQIPMHIAHRRQVYDTWGFGEKLAYGRGLSCLFSGEPGTGKTMCAGIIARELNMELFRVDLSRTVSKYIGETEKHLAEVFEEAERARAIILFDEADALFSKRTEVKSSVDRYANLEVNYLLQRIESYEGVTILTTNFHKSIDDAFKRRLAFKITFPFPNREMRARLWATLIPERAAVEDDLDFEWLAGYELAGGNIKSILLRAAFLAAERETVLSTELLESAVSEEFNEMGKLLQRDG